MVDSCDIILLEASFQLMGDFPPKFSKLGISLELDFLHSSNNNGGSLAALDDWSCTTHMFQHGRLAKEVAHDDCHIAGVGKVKPFFESKWWASTFTQLTEKRKMAEDSKSDGAIELANEHSGNFFRGLTVMQEISAQSCKGQSSKDIWNDNPPRRKRMAILLWKFSQAPKDYVGTTTWQKVIPPTDRFSMNSSTTPMEMSLPALTMDSMLGSSNADNLFNTDSPFLPNGDPHQYALFSHQDTGGLYQDDFMDYRAGSMASFEDPAFDLQPSQVAIDHDMNMAFDLQSHGMSHIRPESNDATTNFFELPQVKTTDSDLKESIHSVPQHDSFSTHNSHQPLAKFDMNTHKMLQAQLGTDDDPFSTQPEPPPSEEPRSPSKEQTDPANLPTHSYLDEDDEALRAALLAASAMSDLGSQQPTYAPPNPSEQQQDPLYIPTSHPFTSPSTLAVRPPLQNHHSFTGTSNVPNDHNFLGSHHSRQSSKNDFASVLANLQAYNSNQDISLSFDFGAGTEDGHEHSALNLGLGISRPQSQPVLAAGVADTLYEDLMGLGPIELGEDRGQEYQGVHEQEEGGGGLGAEREGFNVGSREDGGV